MMKIYQILWMDEKYWICAYVVTQAITAFCQEKTMEVSGFNAHNDIEILPEEEWNNHTIVDPEGNEPEKTFTEYMKGVFHPHMIATTEEL